MILKPLAIIFLLSPHVVSAQIDVDLEKNMGSISIDFGIAHTRTINEGLAFDNFLFAGNGIPVSIQYANTNSHRRTRASFKVLQSNLKAKPDIPATLLHGAIKIDHVRSITHYRIANRQINLMLGAKFSTDVNYFESPALDNEDVLTINALHLEIVNTIALPKSKLLTVQLSIPTVGLCNRIILDGGLHEPQKENENVLDVLFRDSELCFANTYSLEIAYQHPLTRLTRWSTIYQFGYIRNNTIEAARLYRNEIRTGFTFNFR
ncbi:hypothetical protein [Pseudochryseolinea flava]|uniref:Outer membrane protein beta-barrel domain-containing protein n=1 Tax=Pseudochryseolinea flava TaxID=2059302 RepID=A0A364Y6Y4_9BACT|nr:hypothetical protein [Pseudochryseolinea flava]RAW02866.1 hypothetical protein DQQ10_01795 [Pseudochryseolinea flava]